MTEDTGFDAVAWAARTLSWERRFRELERASVAPQTEPAEAAGQVPGCRPEPRRHYVPAVAKAD